MNNWIPDNFGVGNQPLQAAPGNALGQFAAQLGQLAINAGNAIVPALIAREIYDEKPSLNRPAQFDARGNLVSGNLQTIPAAAQPRPVAPAPVKTGIDFQKLAIPAAIGLALLVFMRR